MSSNGAVRSQGGGLARFARSSAIFADSIAIGLSLAVSFAIKFLAPAGTRAILPYAASIGIYITAVWIICLAAAGAYQYSSVATGLVDARIAFRATTLAFLIVGTTAFILKLEFSRVFITVTFPLGLLMMMYGRRFVRREMWRRMKAGEVTERALLVARANTPVAIAEIIDESPTLVLSTARTSFYTAEELSAPDIIRRIVDDAESCDAQAVVLNSGLNFDNQTIAELSWQLDSHSIELLVVPDFLGSWASRLNLVRHESLPLVQLVEPRLNPFQRIQKRALDLLLAVPAFIVLLPFLVLIGLLVKLTSRGPVFFIQPRVGAEGKTFPFYKFRSMRVGADAERLAVLGRPDEGMAERYRHDPRITPFGRFIRRFSLDELPQLWNVIFGQMSIVGPRPMLLEEIPQLGSDHSRRQLAKPGLTGLWQISGRKLTTWDERMNLDLQYINEWSIGFDLAIIFKTFRVIASGEGSY